MNDVPLIQNADVNSINTSIIAIKKQLNQISEMLGLIDIPDAPDLSPFVRKDEVADVIEADNMNPVTSNAVAVSKAMPVNTVTSGNMYSVSSNAVSNSLSYSTSEQATGGKWIDGKPIYRKVIIKTNFEFNTYINNVLDNYDTVIHYDLTILDSSNDRLYSGNCTSQVESWITEVYFLNAQNKIYYGGGSSRGTLPKCIFIFEYTKTT